MEYSRRGTYRDVSVAADWVIPRILSSSSLSVSLTQKKSCSLPFKDDFYYYLHYSTCILHCYTLLNSKFIIMASPRPASGSSSREETTNVPRSDYPSADDLGCLDVSDNSSIDFCNICNFQSVEHHLSSTKPHVFFLTEIQLSMATDSSPFSVPS